MINLTNYRLVQDTNGLTLEIYLDDSYSEEFATEFASDDKEKKTDPLENIKKLVQEKFSDIKINTVKLLIGAIVVGTFTLLPTGQALFGNEVSVVSAATLSTATVTAASLNVRNGPSTSNSVIHVLWQSNTVKVIGETYGWYQIMLSNGRTGWVSSKYVKLNTQDMIRQKKVDSVISSAKSLAGTPYVYGGKSPTDGGFDCSGFTQYVYGQNGYTLNRLSNEQSQNGTYVNRADIQPGDLIFYSFDQNGVINHVGIYLGNGQMIHSPKTGDVVKIANVSTDYWRSRYVTARRIIP